MSENILSSKERPMFFERVAEIRRKMTYADWTVAKISIVTFTLMTAKLWPPVLSLPWYSYALVFALTYAYLAIKLFGSK